MTLSDIAADQKRQDQVSADELRYIWHNTVQPLVTPGLIEEHKSNPFGRHSPMLDMVLTFLRMIRCLPHRGWS
jgi:hypothetical protein